MAQQHPPHQYTVATYPAGSHPGYEPTGQYQPFSNQHLDPYQRSSFSRMNDPWSEQLTRPTFEKTTEYLSIHSDQRDRIQYPNPGNFVVRLADVAGTGSIRGAQTVRFMGGIIPVVSSVPFLLLRIPEFGTGHIKSNNPAMESGFGILQQDNPLSTTGYVTLKSDFNRMARTTPSSSTINQLSITICKPDGTAYDFTGGNGDSGSTANQAYNYVLFFEIEKCAL